MQGDWSMRLDTHCHLDATEFDPDRQEVIGRAQQSGIQAIVIPAVEHANFERVRALAHSFEQGFYALGIHPMYVRHASEHHIEQLRLALATYRDDPKLVAVGEIGLDFFIPEISVGVERAKQEKFYEAQLSLACEFDLPVILHVRRSQDVLLKYLRRYSVRGGIAHAFNGSMQQAHQFIEQDFALGFGGAMTFTRALQIRRLATELPLSAIVLETDAPDIAPAWMVDSRRNEPSQVIPIARCMAQLREVTESLVLEATAHTALRVLPGLAGLASLKTDRVA
jgi:TatD DNase family protein